MHPSQNYGKLINKINIYELSIHGTYIHIQTC